jgi:diketogulonate reductase-like aldo/keto reductase
MRGSKHAPHSESEDVVTAPTYGELCAGWNEDVEQVVGTWKELEKLIKYGKIKAIGVKNPGTPVLEVLFPEAALVPSIVQVDLIGSN